MNQDNFPQIELYYVGSLTQHLW